MSAVRSGKSPWLNVIRRLVPRLRCSFCRRSADEVERLVSGASAYICDACIADCVAVLERHGGFAGTRPVH
jgi:ClpX C4-type zinc finger